MKAWQWMTVTAAIGTLLACAAMPAKIGSLSPDIFYTSQQEADVALEKFEKDNPSCQLWTNWQRMCSRTGKNGAAECISDDALSVRPSTPFCAEVNIGARNEFRVSEQFAVAKSLQFRSRGRFCTFDGSIMHCRSDRPFNGRHLSARRNSLCEIWAEEKAPEFRPICSENTSNTGLRSCAALSKKKFKADVPLYCSKRSEMTGKNICQSISGWGAGPDFGHDAPYEAIALGRKGDLPVIGLYCE